MMKANAAKYFSGGSVTNGVTDKKKATNSVMIGMINGTLYGRGRSGHVLRNTSRHTTDAP